MVSNQKDAVTWFVTVLLTAVLVVDGFTQTTSEIHSEAEGCPVENSWHERPTVGLQLLQAQKMLDKSPDGAIEAPLDGEQQAALTEAAASDPFKIDVDRPGYAKDWQKEWKQSNETSNTTVVDTPATVNITAIKPVESSGTLSNRGRTVIAATLGFLLLQTSANGAIVMCM
mmetsp:Transcript_45860/g.106606  ORF Transcript_45860/g.106606 Transcript_45860/m.106606 type:complete len:171 (+) Transcript_45860:68-580(+)